MLRSPIFHWEMKAIARRERYFVTRWIYGLCLLICIGGPIYSDWSVSSSQEIEHRRLAELNEEFFILTVLVQGLAVLVLTPALVGGAVAEEKQRGGLDILLTTTLSSTEIVLGKLSARMCLMVVILLVATPVFCLMSLNGGVDIGLAALTYGVTLTTGFLIAAMAIFVSTLSDRPLRPIMATYLLVIAWLALPSVPNPFGIGPGPHAISSLLARRDCRCPAMGRHDQPVLRGRRNVLGPVPRADCRSGVDDGRSGGDRSVVDRGCGCDSPTGGEASGIVGFAVQAILLSL